MARSQHTGQGPQEDAATAHQGHDRRRVLYSQAAFRSLRGASQTANQNPRLFDNSKSRQREYLISRSRDLRDRVDNVSYTGILSDLLLEECVRTTNLIC